MEINVAALRALFEPFDVSHLLRLWAVLAFFIFLWGIFVTISGGYPTAKQFWKVHLIVLGATYVLSGVSFWVFHIDPLLLIMSLSVLAFVVQGDLGVKHQETPLEDWWLFRLHHRRSMESEEERDDLPPKPRWQSICKRCGYSWTRRAYKLPTQCPKCKSPYWNRKRVNHTK